MAPARDPVHSPSLTSLDTLSTLDSDKPSMEKRPVSPSPAPSESSEPDLDLAAALGLAPDAPPELVRQITRDIGPPPDGGMTAWLVVLSTFLVLFCIFGMVTSFGQLQSHYLTHQLSAYSPSSVAWIGSTQSTLTFLGSIAAGRYFDAHGPRLLVVAGTALSIGALIGLAFCSEYWHFMLAHVAFGLSGTLTYSPATAISGHWFLKRRSTAVGIIVCGAGAGGVAYPLLMRALFARLAFRDAILSIAALNLVLMLPACVWMRARLPRRAPPPLRALAAPWKEPPYAFLVLGSAAYMLNVFSPYFYAPVFAATTAPSIQGYAVALLQAGSFVGRAGAGILADRVGVWRTFGASGFLSSAVLLACWTGAGGTAAGVLGLVLYGMVSGAWFTLVAAACASISPVHEIGMRLGMLWTLVGVPVLAGPVVCGLLVTPERGFGAAGWFCGGTMMLAAVLMPAPRMWAAVRRCGGREKEEPVV